MESGDAGLELISLILPRYGQQAPFPFLRVALGFVRLFVCARAALDRRIRLGKKTPVARGTNNTGELVGMAQALMWLRDVDSGDDAACICYDSEWAAKTTQGIFKARNKHVVECVDWCKSLLAAENERRKGGVCFSGRCRSGTFPRGKYCLCDLGAAGGGSSLCVNV